MSSLCFRGDFFQFIYLDETQRFSGWNGKQLHNGRAKEVAALKGWSRLRADYKLVWLNLVRSCTGGADTCCPFSNPSLS